MFRLVKNKTPEEREKRRGGIQKTELGELKERLAKTEAALTKLMEATNMISEKMNPDGKSKSPTHPISNSKLAKDLWLLE